MPDSATHELLQGVPEEAVPHRAGTLRSFLYPLLVCSGFAGLGYQIAWTRSLSVSLGHEYIAVLAVVAAFFVGLALGGFALNGILQRTASPARWYCGLELLIGLWALLFNALLPTFNEVFAEWMGTEPGALRHWGVAFTGSLLVLLPATTAMGATLPAIERLSLLLRPGQRAVAGLYAANTAGAMLGALGATFVLLPALGLGRTVVAFASLNFLIAAIVWTIVARHEHRDSAQQDSADSSPTEPTNARLLLLLFATGLLGIGYEVLTVRVLGQVLEGTVYSFAAVLTVYLAGTALGASLYQRWQQDRAAPDTWGITTALILHATALGCALGIASLWLTADVYRWVFDRLGPGNTTGLLAEMAVACVVFLLPTLGMGALFSHLAQGGSRAHGLGKLLGVNTLGAALAPVVFGIVVLPLLGAKLALIIVSVGYFLLAILVSGAAGNWALATPTAAVVALLMFAPLPLRFVPTSAGSKVIAYREGVMAAAAVIEESDGSRHLAVNNQFIMGGTASRFSDHRQTHLPMLLHGNATSALYLGLGTGITLQGAQYYPGLSATGVELIPELPSLMPLFGVDTKGENWTTPPRVLAADARRFVTADDGRYDVVIAEVFHPSRDGAGSLYTVEHFRAVRERLAPSGLFCQWLPLFQLELDTLRLITRTFLSVFPDAHMHLAHFSLGQPLLCLLGSRGPLSFSPDWLVTRVEDRTLQQQLVQLRLNSDFALFGGYLGGAAALNRFAGTGPLNSDDSAAVNYQAPAFVYGEPELPAERLKRLVRALAPERGTLLEPGFVGSDFDRRLQQYWQARDVFLAAGVGVRPAGDVGQMLQQVRVPLLQAVRISPDFMPAYDPLLQMARALAPRQPDTAIALLRELEEANPQVPLARKLREQISRTGPSLLRPNPESP